MGRSAGQVAHAHSLRTRAERGGGARGVPGAEDMSSGSDSDWPLEPWTVQVLGDVRQRGYAPVAWAGLLASSWQRARETAHRETVVVSAHLYQ